MQLFLHIVYTLYLSQNTHFKGILYYLIELRNPALNTLARILESGLTFSIGLNLN